MILNTSDGLPENGMRVEYNVFRCKLHSFRLFQLFFAQKLEGYRDSIADCLSQELSNLIFNSIIQTALNKLFLLGYVLIGKRKVELKLML